MRILKPLAALALAGALHGQTGPLSIISGSINFSAATHVLPVRVDTTIPATCTVGELFFKSNASAGNNLYLCTALNTWTQLTSASGGTVVHATSINVGDGTNAISTGDLGRYVSTGPNTGTITRVDIVGFGGSIAVPTTCSITLDIWATAGALPTSGNKISASAPVTLSTQTVNQSGSLSGWSTTVSNNFIWSATVATVTGCLSATVTIFYQ